VLSGETPGEPLFRRAAEAAAATIEPLVDPQVDASYRRELVAAMVHRALQRALA
jgi:CO/xanthine dehydrogenase FAD-binding subunit